MADQSQQRREKKNSHVLTGRSALEAQLRTKDYLHVKD